ncbi:MAG: TlpA family protein disulfide reductase [Tannerella sp.]|jgi:peroxiredoxin|nr:TlpA family protein disulfide reductase [Tannerella sp.]
MKTYLWTFAFLLAGTVSPKAQEVTEVVQFGDHMPAFTIVSDDGSSSASSEQAGKVILINFFATWCPACQIELAEIEKTLWPQYKDRDDFVLLSIGREHSDDELATYNQKKKFSFPLYPDKNRKIFDTFALKFIPRTYLVDKTGRVIYITVGFKKTDFEQLLRTIDKALAE